MQKGIPRTKLLLGRFERYRQYGFVFSLAVVLSMGFVGTATATTTSTSTHYSVTETQFGGGSQQHQCSATYCAKSSAGDTAVGNASSTNYSAQFGSNTTDQPLLQVQTGGTSTHDLGVIDSDRTAVASSALTVRTYLMQGYGIELTGSSPSQGTHAILPLSIPTESQPGHEQFGVNLVANTDPVIGTDPTLQPSGESALQYIASGYSQANKFKYIPGDMLAENFQQSGEISYTLSMILNVSNVTPGGQYKGSFSAVVVPVF
jgi:hypothetical protein